MQNYDFQAAQEIMYTKEILTQEERDMCMFKKIWLNPMETHNPNYDILCGRVDDDIYITYCLQVKGPCPGAETMEIYSGLNYNPKSKKRSWSRHYSKEAVPKVWKAQWLKLKELYDAQHKRN